MPMQLLATEAPSDEEEQITITKRTWPSRAVMALASAALLGGAAFAGSRVLPSVAQSPSVETDVIEDFSLFNKKKPPATSAASSHTKPSSSSHGVTWTLGAVGETCDLTCSKLSNPSKGTMMECSAESFRNVRSEAAMTAIMKSVKPKALTCKKPTKATTAGSTPQYYKSFFSSAKCTYNSGAVGTCYAAPASSYQNLCPCQSQRTVTRLQWRVAAKTESCDVTCGKLNKAGAPSVCDAKALAGVNTMDKLKVVMNQVQPKKISCKPKEYKNLQNTPEVIKGYLSNDCAFNSKSNPLVNTCAGVPEKSSYLRICPCGPPNGGPPLPSQSNVHNLKPATSKPPRIPSYTTYAPVYPTYAPVYPTQKPPSKPSVRPTKKPTRPSASQTSPAFWIRGQSKQDCSTVCRAKGAQCVESMFAKVSGQGVWQLSGQLGQQCTGLWTNDNLHGAAFANSPSECVSPRGCPSGDAFGLCAIPKAGMRGTCRGVPAPGFARMCPCKGGKYR